MREAYALRRATRKRNRGKGRDPHYEHRARFSNVRNVRRLFPKRGRISERLNLSDPAQRMRLGLILTGITVCGGTIGYIIMGIPPADALYHTVITISTVGFSEPAREFASKTLYEFFTIALILLGTGTLLYALSMMVEGFFDRELNDRLWRRRMRTAISDLMGHTIVCGYGQVGRAISQGLVRQGVQVVVIDRKHFDDDLPVLFWEAEATDDQTLADAGIGRASTLVLALDSDVDNLYVALSARAARPDLLIVARANTPSAAPKLERAGANRVINPHEIGGARMAEIATHPHVSTFLDTTIDHPSGAGLRTYVVPPDATWQRTDLAGLHAPERWGVKVLAVGRDGDWLRELGGSFQLSPGDVLVLVGTQEQLNRALEELDRDAAPAR